MNRAPAFQFYVKDWLSDPQLKLTSPETKGVWIDLICNMWQMEPRGIVTFALHEFCQLLNINEDCFMRFLSEAQKYGFANVTCNGDVRNCNTEVTIENRRMARDDKVRMDTRLRVAKLRDKAKCNADVTLDTAKHVTQNVTLMVSPLNVPPTSPSLSPSSKDKDTPPPPSRGVPPSLWKDSEPPVPIPEIILTIPTNKNGSEYPITQADIDEFKDTYKNVDVLQEIKEFRTWSLTNPTKRKTKRGMMRAINIWLSKEQDKGGSQIRASPYRSRHVSDEEAARITQEVLHGDENKT